MEPKENPNKTHNNTDSQKEKKSVDRRVLKTKRAIRNAFAKLMTEKDINDITIIELAEAADINRKTFYNYYSGVYQVVEDIESDILKSYNELLGNVEFKEYMEAPFAMFDRFSQLINMDPEFFGYLLSMNGNINLITRIMNLLKEKTCEVMVTQLAIEQYRAEVMIDFVLSGMLSVYQHWLASDQTTPLEEISKIIKGAYTKLFGGV